MSRGKSTEQLKLCICFYYFLKHQGVKPIHVNLSNPSSKAENRSKAVVCDAFKRQTCFVISPNELNTVNCSSNCQAPLSRLGQYLFLRTFIPRSYCSISFSSLQFCVSNL